MINLDFANVSHATMARCNLSHASLQFANWTHVNLNGANFTATIWDGVRPKRIHIDWHTQIRLPIRFWRHYV